MKSWLPLLLVLPLLGCATRADYPAESPYYTYPGGARLSLNRALEIPPDSATVRLQFGHPVARNGVHEEEPYCVFELNTVREQAQRVDPGRITVTDIQRRVRTIASLSPWATQPAVRRVGLSDDDMPSHLYFITEFRLRSDTQPNIRSLACMHNQMMPGVAIMRHLTLPQIRSALGDYFTLDITP